MVLTQATSVFTASSVVNPVRTSRPCRDRCSCSRNDVGEQTPRSEFWGCSKITLIGNNADEDRRSGRTNGIVRLCVRAEGLNFWEVLGGRGLKGGEIATNTKEGLNVLFAEPEGSGKKKKKGGNGAAAAGEVDVSLDGFEKELSGLVGGFPGGEKGLGKFLQKYPPPGKDTKASQELERLLEAIPQPGMTPKTIVPPLLMPGMTVVVKELRNPYYMFTGIVQRVTDGRAGVLFEGGNWDKLISFKLTDLKRSAQGPPMTNPKSAILLLQQEKVEEKVQEQDQTPVAPAA